MSNSENSQDSKEALPVQSELTASPPPKGNLPRPGLVKLTVWQLSRNPHILFAIELGKNPAEPANRLRVAIARNHGLKPGTIIECRHRGADYYEHVPPPPPPLVLGKKTTSPA